MNKKNVFIFLSLLNIPTGYLYAAAESVKERLRRETLEDMYRGLIDRAFSTDEASFFYINRESLDFEKEESGNIVIAQAATIPIITSTLQKTTTNKKWYTPNTIRIPNTVTEIKKPTTKRGESLVEIIVNDTVFNEEIAELIENYEKPRLQERVIKGNGDEVKSIAISPNGDIIAAAINVNTINVADDNNIYLYDAETGMQVKILKGHTGKISSIAFSPDGQLIASGSYDGTIRIWHIETGESLKTIQHPRAIGSVTFSPNGQLIASGSHDAKIRIFDAKTYACLNTLYRYNSAAYSVAFSPDSQLITSGHDNGKVCIWHVPTAQHLKTLDGNTRVITSVTFSPDGQLIASAAKQNTIHIFDTKTYTCLNTLTGCGSEFYSVAFSPDGQYIASGSRHNIVQLWHVATGECLKNLEGSSYHSINSITFSPDGQHIVSGSSDNTIRIWDIEAILAPCNQNEKWQKYE